MRSAVILLLFKQKLDINQSNGQTGAFVVVHYDTSAMQRNYRKCWLRLNDELAIKHSRGESATLLNYISKPVLVTVAAY